MKQDQHKKQAIINNTVGLPQDVDTLLEKFAKRLHKSKGDCIFQAIINYLEDQEDIAEAEAVLARNEKTYSHEEAKRILGLGS
jgi:predicted DNA-binding protein